MARLLALDIGSSSVKAAVVAAGRIVGPVARAPIATHFIADRVEIPAQRIFSAICAAVDQLDRRRIDCVAISSMGPSWVAMDVRGRPLTPVVKSRSPTMSGVEYGPLPISRPASLTNVIGVVCSQMVAPVSTFAASTTSWPGLPYIVYSVGPSTAAPE